jgi:hypothetical protein
VVLSVENAGETLTPRSRHRTHSHRPRWRRPRPGNRQKHHPSTLAPLLPRSPGIWRALRAGATTHSTARRRRRDY